MSSMQRYQQGSIELRPTTAGLCWYIRFNNPPGLEPARPRFRIGLKSQIPSKARASQLAQHIRDRFNGTPEAMVQRTMGDVIARYRAEEMPERFSTSKTYQGILNKHIEPRWSHQNLEDMRPAEIRSWLEEIPLAPRSRAHIRDLMRVLLRFAMLWQWMPAAVNPTSLFKLKGASRRGHKPLSLTPAEFGHLLSHITHEPTRTMMLCAACLGLRMSEIGALRWRDADWINGLLCVESAIVHGREGAVKTEASQKALPLHPQLAAVLRQWRQKTAFTEPWQYIFASPHQAGDKPYAMHNLQRNHLRPAGKRAGLGDSIGWHTLRHSYRSWCREAGLDMEEQRDLMRHSDIATTMNVYGDTFDETLRKANASVIQLVMGS